MSGIGFWELIFLFLIGLIVLGPERLPRVANQLGSWLGQARRMTRVMRRQLEDELNLEQSIRPPPQKALPAKPAAEVDDIASPAQEPDSPGTGVGAADTASRENAGEAAADRDGGDEPEATPSSAAASPDDDGRKPEPEKSEGETGAKKVSNSTP